MVLQFKMAHAREVVQGVMLSFQLVREAFKFDLINLRFDLSHWNCIHWNTCNKNSIRRKQHLQLWGKIHPNDLHGAVKIWSLSMEKYPLTLHPNFSFEKRRQRLFGSDFCWYFPRNIYIDVAKLTSRASGLTIRSSSKLTQVKRLRMDLSNFVVRLSAYYLAFCFEVKKSEISRNKSSETKFVVFQQKLYFG